MTFGLSSASQRATAMSGNQFDAMADIGHRLKTSIPWSGVTGRSGRGPGASPAVPDIQIVAYTDDRMLSGHMQLSGERISDVLNDLPAFTLTDALMEDLVDGPAIAVHALLLQRDEVLLVDASGPRGNVGRRRHTCQHPIVAQAGPYEVHGNVHALPGCDPIASLRGRKPMVAITDAVISYLVGSAPRYRDVALILLNHERIDHIAREARLDAASVEMPIQATGKLFKDYTGLLYA